MRLMANPWRLLNACLAAALIAGGSGAVLAESAASPPASPLERLFAELRDPAVEHWERTERAIVREWSRSGSAAMDLLLTRGRQAIEARDFAVAVEHFTALVDHAPDFAEGWHGRATAYYLLGQYGPALDDLHRVLSLEPRHFGALAGLGVMLEEMGLYREALAAYRAVEALHPRQPAAQAGIARVERRLQGETL